MDTCELVKANLNNLGELWRLMGADELVLDGSSVVNISRSWPHRLWSDVGRDLGEKFVDSAVNHLLTKDIPYVIPVWGAERALLVERAKQKGFGVLFEQIGMSLSLDRVARQVKESLFVFAVNSPRDICTWTTIASQSFGYDIDTSVIEKTAADPRVQLLQCCGLDGTPVGTALVFETGGVMGIHLVGVLPAYRRQGFAKKIMDAVLQDCLQRGGKFATLQASAMGERLYRDLGFVEQFKITSMRVISS